MNFSDKDLSELAAIGVTSTSTTAPEITISGLMDTQKKLFASHPLRGLEICLDSTGMMCPENGYIIFVGKKLYAKLKDETK